MKRPEIVLTSSSPHWNEKAKEAGAKEFVFGSYLRSYIASLEGKVIAYVDDNLIARDSVRMAFGDKGVAHIYSSGEEALKSIPNLDPPVDVVISDVEMPPGMNGIVFIQELLKLYEA